MPSRVLVPSRREWSTSAKRWNTSGFSDVHLQSDFKIFVLIYISHIIRFITHTHMYIHIHYNMYIIRIYLQIISIRQHLASTTLRSPVDSGVKEERKASGPCFNLTWMADFVFSWLTWWIPASVQKEALLLKRSYSILLASLWWGWKRDSQEAWRQGRQCKHIALHFLYSFHVTLKLSTMKVITICPRPQFLTFNP